MAVSEFIVPAGCGRGGIKLIDFLSESLALSRKKTKAVIDSRRVFVNRRRAWMAAYTLKSGDRVEVEGEVVASAVSGPAAAKVKFSRKSVLFEDEHYVVVSKPAGIESTGGDGLEAQVRVSWASKALCAVHRLDRDTTGALIFAKSRDAFQKAVAMFKARKIHKTYIALVRGICRAPQTIDRPVANALAVSRITRILSSNSLASLLEVEIETGRKHQVRVHLAAVGLPVAGDTRYGPGRVRNDGLRRVPRQMLHAASLTFPHPYTGEEILLRSPVPEDFRACLRDLGLALKGE